MKDSQQKRRYEQRRRAQGTAQTRRRIVQTALALHRTVGPAAASITEIARRARVQRATVYNHFPSDAELFAACSAHWRSLHPSPDLALLRQGEDPRGRLVDGLSSIYRWYRETEPMTANVLRDSEALPALAKILDGGLRDYLRQAAATIAEPFRADGVNASELNVVVDAVLGFYFWRSLKPLGDVRAADIAATLVEAVGRAPRSATSSRVKSILNRTDHGATSP